MEVQLKLLILQGSIIFGGQRSNNVAYTWRLCIRLKLHGHVWTDEVTPAVVSNHFQSGLGLELQVASLSATLAYVQKS